jgi:KaiC/GvpD/RAD55 family RecA-like ATPase
MIMIKRENDARRGDVRFNGNDISLAAKLLDKLTTTVEIIYYLMNRREERSFVVMLVTAENIAVQNILVEQKRDTDILFEIDKEESIYAIICQDTKIDGGYHFGERVMRHMKLNEAKMPYCVELEVRTTTHDIKYIIFKLMEEFIKARDEKRSGEIIFKTLY